MDQQRTRLLQRKGRGAASNESGRYQAHQRKAFDDGWGSIDDNLPPLDTQISIDSSRTIIARNSSPDIPFDRSINPYRGCEHGCVYCFARPTHAWLGLSPGQDFESKLLMKPNAALLLRQELAKPGYRPRVIALGTNTDPYQPIERSYGITRQILEVLQECRHPVGIVTKSSLIARDADILGPMAKQRLARAYISVTTLDRDLARRMEPRAPTPAKRLQAMEALARAGVPVGVMFAPIVPGLNDQEMEDVLQAASDAGATTGSYVLLRLPLEIKDLFREWLEAHYPDKAGRVMTLVRDCRGGRDYDSEWGKRLKGTGPFADMVARRFTMACRRYSLDKRSWEIDTNRFIKPAADTDQFALL
ncbi:MAG: radical SAM protein [Rhodospirillaceae bacterium]|nr:radical SAM protein [Rhodospirillaceae bacterium]|tara:strand:- start:9317 stop:10399 length:1083 start_codon:yes stop_codon:yes gene_type:complete